MNYKKNPEGYSSEQLKKINRDIRQQQIEAREQAWRDTLKEMEKDLKRKNKNYTMVGKPKINPLKSIKTYVKNGK
jgi:poly-D-alanine transfer protein DltD